MSQSFELSVEVSQKYPFSKASLDEIQQNVWVKNQWPLVYFIENNQKKIAYIGESTNFLSRIKSHLANPKKSQLKEVSIIGSDKFNKSVTLDIESKLIQYLSSEGTFTLQNRNYGLLNHNYYQQERYSNLFKEIWNQLSERNVVSKSLEEIENSELFKYSPYKSLSEDQYNSVLQILDALNTKDSRQIFVKGSAGTGKTILATYLIKLLTSDFTEDSRDELNEADYFEIDLIKKYKKNNPEAEVAIVVAMTSLRKTLQNVFRRVPDLKTSMIISPSDTFKKPYDLLIVDEAHRLRQYKNIGWMGTFKKNNRKLNLDDSGTELDWIIANSKKQIFFYDAAQSVKPSDIDRARFKQLLAKKVTISLELKSQMRVKGGNDYITFVDKLLNVKFDEQKIYEFKDYEITLFDDMGDLYSELKAREDKLGLCRLIAGYAWSWKSDPKRKPLALDAIDIEIDGLQFQWNSTDKDWINSSKAFSEIGCIHTTQGYDLNYAGIIFGKEIMYNPETDEIEINAEEYYDMYGKRGIDNPEDLKSYIINIYKTIMYRGIRGVFIYACDENLRDYFKLHIPEYSKDKRIRFLNQEDVKPFVNSVPFYDVKVAAGGFSEPNDVENVEWVELPFNISVREDYFVCKVFGNSMNELIPNNSYCLFKKYSGGSRNGKIVLVQHQDIQDQEYGAGYTIKKYSSTKVTNEDSWSHESIELLPMSDDPSFEKIILAEDSLIDLKVIGEYVQVIG